MKRRWLPNIAMAVAVVGIVAGLILKNYLETLGALALLVASAIWKVLDRLLVQEIEKERSA